MRSVTEEITDDISNFQGDQEKQRERETGKEGDEKK